jgi:hypothetical protein
MILVMRMSPRVAARLVAATVAVGSIGVVHGSPGEIGQRPDPAVDAAPRAGAPPAAGPLRLEFEAPPSLAPQVARLAGGDASRFAALMRLVGLEDPGPPVRVHLVPEDSRLAQAMPDWVAGFAHGGQVVIFPQRTPSYPHESLSQVLEHEVGHVLIDRAAGGARVPRWFHEGVAMTAERSWSLGDRAQYVSDVAFGGAVPVRRLDALFEAGPGGAARAYRLSDAFVRDLLEQHGPDLPARLLRRIRAGAPFDRAFQQVTATTVDSASEAFWDRRWMWATWLPWITSPSVLYSVMTLMALAGAWRVYVRRRRRRRLDEDDAWVPGESTPPAPAAPEIPEPHDPRRPPEPPRWVH